MPDDPKDQETGFKVTDRRLFTEDGELRPEAAEQGKAERPDPKPQPETRRSPGPERLTARPESGQRRSADPGTAGGDENRMDFTSFVLSLATSAMMQMGEIPDPVTGRPGENLEAARQTIDVLDLLKEKTRGNLTADENRVMEGLLYELRLKYLSKAKVIKF
jgi:hypothetical protein